MAHILILSLVFPPDSVSTAQIMGQLAVDLQARGHDVVVLTTFPHYNRDLEAEVRQPLHNYWGQLLQKSTYSDIPVYHTFMPRKGASILLRLLAWSGFHLISIFAGITVISRPEVIFAPSPPLTIGLVAWLLGSFHRIPYIYNVQEIYPDVAANLGAIRSKWLIRLLLRLESFVYSRASIVTVIAPQMRQRLLEKRVPADKVRVIPNFVDVGEFQPLPKDNGFSHKYDLHDKFVVSYAGNLGPAQGLETIIEAATLLRDRLDIRFVMMGNGMLQETLKKKVNQLGLPNFAFLPYQSYSLMPQIYAASDISLVPQAAETGCDAVPSKVYRIMACARPVLAVTDPNSDLAHLVRDAGCGAVVQPGSAKAIADVILGAYHDQELWQCMGQAGYGYVVAHYTRPMVSQHYHDVIQTLALGAVEGKRP